MAVQISTNDGTDWTTVGSGGTFEYLRDPHAVALGSSSGPTTGGSVLTVYGVGWVDTGALACHFGYHHAHDSDSGGDSTTDETASEDSASSNLGSVAVRATWISAHELACTTPPFHPGPVVVEVRLRDHISSTFLTFALTETSQTKA